MSARQGELAALAVLEKVTAEGAYSNEAIAHVFKEQKIKGPARAAALAYVRLTLENWQACEFILAQYTKLNQCGRTVRNILRMSTARLLFSQAADATVVHAAVELTRASRKGAQSKFVNAVLRNVSRHKEHIPWPDVRTQPSYALAVRYSWPQWAAQEAVDILGVEEATQFLSCRSDGGVSFRVNLRQATREATLKTLASMQIQAQPSRLCQQGLLAYGVENAVGLSLYRKGIISLQGQASMLAAQQMQNVHGTVLDVCAAPGGKACAVAEMLGKNAQVHAFDIHPHRVALIQAQAARLQLDNVHVHVWDAKQPFAPWQGKADAVLVDAPCSGLGTALHRPDVKINRQQEDIRALACEQAAILQNAAACVRPQGRLIYCTCTFIRAENEAIVQQFLAHHPAFVPDDLYLPETLRNRVRQGMLQLWPHRDGTDAFFIAAMKRL